MNLKLSQYVEGTKQIVTLLCLLYDMAIISVLLETEKQTWGGRKEVNVLGTHLISLESCLRTVGNYRTHHFYLSITLSATFLQLRVALPNEYKSPIS